MYNKVPNWKKLRVSFIAADKSEGMIALSEEINIECDEVAVTCRQVATNYLATCLKEDTSSPAPVSVNGNGVFNLIFFQNKIDKYFKMVF